MRIRDGQPAWVRGHHATAGLRCRGSDRPEVWQRGLGIETVASSSSSWGRKESSRARRTIRGGARLCWTFARLDKQILRWRRRNTVTISSLCIIPVNAQKASSSAMSITGLEEASKALRVTEVDRECRRVLPRRGERRRRTRSKRRSVRSPPAERRLWRESVGWVLLFLARSVRHRSGSSSLELQPLRFRAATNFRHQTSGREGSRIRLGTLIGRCRNAVPFCGPLRSYRNGLGKVQGDTRFVSHERDREVCRRLVWHAGTGARGGLGDCARERMTVVVLRSAKHVDRRMWQRVMRRKRRPTRLGREILIQREPRPVARSSWRSRLRDHVGELLLALAAAPGSPAFAVALLKSRLAQ